jgi:WD40 repeat protein/serine/threonine protein kinase
VNDSLSKIESVEQLAEEFLTRYRQGERPSLSEYVHKHPDLAELIREYFPAMVVMEELGSFGGSANDTVPRTVTEGGKIPQQLGEYRILREVGRGGMGIVYEAAQESLGRHVALKVLPFHGLLNPTHLERFRREARAAARLHHTNIVPVFGVGEHGGLCYYAMQFIQGQGLHEVLHEIRRLRGRRQVPARAQFTLAANVAESMLVGQFASKTWLSADLAEAPTDPAWADGPVAAAQPPLATPTHSQLSSKPGVRYFRSVAQIGVQVAAALQYAHGEGVLHRDIKPSNLLLDTTGRVWLTDFGLAKAEEANELTDPGDIVGTLCYMAPERFHSQADARSDVYGLGITLYEFLTLQPAFANAPRAALIEQVLCQEPPRPRKLDPRIPRDLETIVLKAIAKDPADRYATAQALAEDLRQFLADRPIRARRTPLRERAWRWCRRNPALSATASLAGAALTAVAVLSIALATNLYRAAAQLRGGQAQIATALEQAEAERDRAERLSATLALDRALSLCEQRDVPLGVLWLTRALEIAPYKEPELARAIRANLALWERELCPLKGLLQHEDGVSAVAWSPDGQTLLTGGWEACGRLWRANMATVLGSPPYQEALIEHVGFSPNNRLAFTLAGGRVQVWDVTTDKRAGRPIVSKGFISAAVFAHSSKEVVTGDSNGKVLRWRATTGECLGELVSQVAAIRALDLSPDDHLLVTGDDYAARLWDVTSGRPRGEPLPHQAAVKALAFSHDGSRLVSGSQDGAARLWYTPTGRLQGLPLRHSGPVLSVAFSGDDQSVLTCSLDGTARLWSAATGKPRGLPLRHRGQAMTAAFSPDCKTMVTGGVENVVRLWDVSKLQRPQASFTHGQWVRCLAFSPCGRYLVTGSDDKTARLWDLKTPRQVGRPFQHAERVRSVAFSPDGRMLLTTSFDGIARRWEVATGRSLGPPVSYGNSIWATAFSPDSKRFLMGGDGNDVRCWDSRSGERLGLRLRHPDRVNGLAWSPDGRIIVTACLDGAARLWDTGTGQGLGIELRHRAAVWTVAFSPDGRTVLTGGWDGTARLWDTATGQPKGKTFPHQAKVEAVAFSPDGCTILTGGFDHSARLWDVATGKPLGPRLAQDDLVLAVAFHPNGKMVATGGGDHTARLWELPPPAEGAVKDLLLESQLLTGMELDTEGATIVLPAQAWYRRQQQMQSSSYLCP